MFGYNYEQLDINIQCRRYGRKIKSPLRNRAFELNVISFYLDYDYPNSLADHAINETVKVAMNSYRLRPARAGRLSFDEVHYGIKSLRSNPDTLKQDRLDNIRYALYRMVYTD